jgi:hypothetical protein
MTLFQKKTTTRKRRPPAKKKLPAPIKSGLTAAASLVTGTVLLQLLTAVSYVGVCEFRATKSGQCTFQWLVLGAFAFGGTQTVAALFVQASRTVPTGATVQILGTLADGLLAGSQGGGVAPSGGEPPVVPPSAPRARRSTGARSTTRENQIG